MTTPTILVVQESPLLPLSLKSHIKYISYFCLFYFQTLYPKSDLSSLPPLQALWSEPPSFLSTETTSTSLPSPFLPGVYFQHYRVTFTKHKAAHVSPCSAPSTPRTKAFPALRRILDPLPLQFFPSTLSTCTPLVIIRYPISSPRIFYILLSYPNVIPSYNASGFPLGQCYPLNNNNHSYHLLRAQCVQTMSPTWSAAF